MRPAIASGLLLLGSITITLLLGEAACRLAGQRGLEMYQPDRELGWVLQPNQSTVTRVGHLPVRINSDGFRDDPLERTKPAGTVRIFALGGSSTFGWGVRQAEVYHQVLERMLNDSARAAGSPVRFEIVNAGIIGYNLWQVAHSMRRITDGYQPDGFLVAYTFNDGWNRVGRMGAAERDRMLAGVRRKNLLRASALFNWLIDVRARRLSHQAERGGFDNGLATAQTADTTASVSELTAYRATLDSMVTLAQKASLSLGFTVLAARGQGRLWPRQAAMVETSAAAPLPQIDLLPAFSAAAPDSVYLAADAVHPSPYGHALIAQLMYAELCRYARRARQGDPAGIYRPGCGAAPHNPKL